jgi:hypothetical protein
MNKNIAIKGDETEKTGKNIIEILENLGGKNPNKVTGVTDYYYYIFNNIINSNSIEIVKQRSKKCIIYESLEDYLNSLNQNINYNDI